MRFVQHKFGGHVQFGEVSKPDEYLTKDTGILVAGVKLPLDFNVFFVVVVCSTTYFLIIKIHQTTHTQIGMTSTTGIFYSPKEILQM